MKVVLSTDTVHERDRIATWQKYASDVYFRHDFESDLGPAFEGMIRAGRLGAIGLSMMECKAGIGERSRTVARQDRSDRLFVGLQMEGSITLQQDGRLADVTPNSLVLLDPHRPCTVSIPSSTRTLVLEVPRSELHVRMGDVSSFTASPVSSAKPTAALAAGFLKMASERLSALRGAEAGGKIAHQLLDLIALAFETDGNVERSALSSSRRGTLLRLKAVIEDKLRDPALKPADVAAAAGISVRYANTLLAIEGSSLERFIVERRLNNCRQMLSSPAHASRTVSDIAYWWGFADLSHFNRRYKAHFGCSPGQSRLRPSEELDGHISTAESQAMDTLIG